MTLRNAITKSLGPLIFVGSISYFCVVAWQNFRDIPALDYTSAATWGVLTISVMLHIASLVIRGVAWFLLMRGLRSPLPLRPSMGVMFTSQIGKYLPGNVCHFVGRVALARQLGASVEAASA